MQQCPSQTHVTSESIKESTPASCRVVHKESIWWTGEMVWWVKVPAAKPDDLSVISGVHLVGEEN